MTEANSEFKSGYAAIIGRPNVGKSTLLNQLVTRKIAAMSRKPQTTRNNILGVVHAPGGQVILIDTPGIHESEDKLNRLMVQASLSALQDVDLVIFMIDAEKGFLPEDAGILDSVTRQSTPCILLINKIDLVPKPKLLGMIAEAEQRGLFPEIVPVSALKSDGLDLLVRVLLNHLPQGPKYFPEDMVTDSPEEFLIGEIVREKIMNLTRMEVPYSTAVVVDRIEENDNGVWVINATVYVEKASQKKIVIGEKGALLKKIGRLARQEIEKRFAVRVYLSLFVKVKNHWREDDRWLKEFGYLHDKH